MAVLFCQFRFFFRICRAVGACFELLDAARICGFLSLALLGAYQMFADIEKVSHSHPFLPVTVPELIKGLAGRTKELFRMRFAGVLPVRRPETGSLYVKFSTTAGRIPACGRGMETGPLPASPESGHQQKNRKTKR
jgi:hypothetical protein